ncbi:MAG: hypothetical protein VCF08_07635 [Alphaproteobacteria bacterium]
MSQILAFLLGGLVSLGAHNHLDAHFGRFVDKELSSVISMSRLAEGVFVDNTPKNIQIASLREDIVFVLFPSRDLEEMRAGQLLTGADVHIGSRHIIVNRKMGVFRIEDLSRAHISHFVSGGQSVIFQHYGNSRDFCRAGSRPVISMFSRWM